MGLHAILEAIRSAGDAAVRETEARAYAQAQEILSAAQLEAGRLREQACSAALEPAAHERARLVHRARLEAMQITGGVRKELVDAALEQTRGRLANLRTDACYPAVMCSLLLEALAELNRSEPAAQNCGKIHLEAAPADRPLLEGLLHSLQLNLPVSYPLKCWGGVVAKSEDGRIVVINTLEARLEKAVPMLRRSLAAYFEAERPDIGFLQPIDHPLAAEPQTARR
jgi:vacuolar-type H+-ATPase subunit E/Vma4